MNDIAATSGTGFMRTYGIFKLSVYAYGESANEAVAKGDKIYLDTGVLNKDETNGDFFGVALEAVTSGSTTLISVLVGYTPSVDIA
jgi:predicted RecA/RadA family phage recombinase